MTSIITINEHAHGDDSHEEIIIQRVDENWFYHSFDARVWAHAFCEAHPEMDEQVMAGWFANALMRGYDEARLASPVKEVCPVADPRDCPWS